MQTSAAISKWHELGRGAAVRFGARGPVIFAELVARIDGLEAVKCIVLVNVNVIKQRVAKALARLMEREVAGAGTAFDDPRFSRLLLGRLMEPCHAAGDAELVGRLRVANRTERMRARKARKEKRKRVASRWKKAFKRVVKQVARLKLLDKLRNVMRGIFGGKLATSAVKLAGPALGMAFGGPLGAALGAKLAGAMAGHELAESNRAPKLQAQDLYRLGCACA